MTDLIPVTLESITLNSQLGGSLHIPEVSASSGGGFCQQHFLTWMANIRLPSLHFISWLPR